MLFVTSVFILWGLYGIVSVLSEMNEKVSPQAAWHLLGVMGVFYLPLIGIGLGTIARRLWALWAGTLVLLLDLGFALAVLLDLYAYDLGGLHADSAVRGPIWSLAVIYLSLNFLAYLIALRAYYSNWNVMRWSRDRPATGVGAQPRPGEH